MIWRKNSARQFIFNRVIPRPSTWEQLAVASVIRSYMLQTQLGAVHHDHSQAGYLMEENRI